LKKEGKENVDKIAKYITTTANKYNIDVDILLAMAGTESNYKHAGTVSNKGARGIMQITPIAAKDAHVRLQGGSEKTFDFDDMLDLKKNIDVAGRKLADLSKTHNNVIEMMLAAYNGGRRQATAWRAYKANTKFDKNGGKAPALTKETRQYVERCLMLYKLYKKINKSA
jgi:soluble lytic murein transglycosylase-like protein